MTSEQDLTRSTRRRAIVVTTIAGIVLIALGVSLFYVGATFEEPAQRLATRSVPKAAPILLSVGGVIVAIVGLWRIVRGLRSGRR